MPRNLIVSLLSFSLIASAAHAQMGMYDDPMMGGMMGGGAQKKEEEKPKEKVYEQVIIPVEKLEEEDLSPFFAKQEQDPRFTKLHYYAQKGNENKASAAVAAGDDVNGKDVLGNTAMHYAAEHGRMAIIKLLVPLQADVNVANAQGVTPLYAAAEKGQLSAMDLLVKFGAKVNVDDVHGDPLAFRLVQDPERFGELKWLAEQKLNLFKKNSEGKTMLQVAKATEGAEKTFEYLKDVYTKAIRDYYAKRGEEVPKGALNF